MKTINILNDTEVFDFLLENDDICLVAYHEDFKNYIKKGSGIDSEWHKNYIEKFTSEINTTESETVSSNTQFIVRKNDNFIKDNFAKIRGLADITENQNLSFKLIGTKNDYKIHIFYKDVLIEIIENSALKNKNNTEIKIFTGKNNFVIINSFMLKKEFIKLKNSTEITITKYDFNDSLEQYKVEKGALYKLSESSVFFGEECGSESIGNGITATYNIVDNEQVYLIIDDINEILTHRSKLYYHSEHKINHLNELKTKVNNFLNNIGLENI